MPTLLSLCGLDVPDTVQGRDLSGVLVGRGAAPDDEAAFIETGGGQVGVRTPTHLYGIDTDPETHEVTDDALYFFDLSRDPHQLDNLAGTDRQAELGARLRRRVLDWHRSTPWLDVPPARTSEADQ